MPRFDIHRLARLFIARAVPVPMAINVSIVQFISIMPS